MTPHIGDVLTDLPVLTTPGQLTDIGLQKELVPVPEWGHAVWVWELTGAEVDQWRKSMYKTKNSKLSVDPSGSTMRLLALAVRNANGDKLFPPDGGDLNNRGAGAVERLATVARRLSGLTEDEEDEDEAVKPSRNGLMSGSFSTSPATSDTPALSS